MTRPTFVVQEDLVRISVRGIPHPQGRYYIPDDQGIVRKLLVEMIEGRLPHDVRTELSGGGQLVALWHRDDAPKILAWLKGHADQVEAHP